MEVNEHPRNPQHVKPNVEMDRAWESDTQFDPLMDHIFYTRSARFTPRYSLSARPQPNFLHQQAIYNSTPWMISPQSVRRPYHSRASTYPEHSTPRLRDSLSVERPRSAVAQRILKEQAAASMRKSQMTPVSPSHVDSGNFGEDTSHIPQTPPREQLNQSHVSPTATLSTQTSPSTFVDQGLLSQELGRLMPTLDGLSAQPVNSYSIVCDKASVMVQRVHEFARKMNDSLGEAASGTPFASPDQLTASILGLSWRAVKRAVEKPRISPGPLPPCRVQHRPHERRVTKKHKRGEIPIDTRIAIVKDYIVNRHTQSVCATKYDVKLSYVQYVVKRFRQSGIVHIGDTLVDQNELPREPNGAIRESALIRRLNDMPDPPIMKEKEMEIEREDHEDTPKSRRGRKRKGFVSEEMEGGSKRSSISVWSDIDDDGEEKKNSSSLKHNAGEGIVQDDRMDTESSETADELMMNEESIIETNTMDPEGDDVNILDTSSDEGEKHRHDN